MKPIILFIVSVLMLANMSSAVEKNSLANTFTRQIVSKTGSFESEAKKIAKTLTSKPNGWVEGAVNVFPQIRKMHSHKGDSIAITVDQKNRPVTVALIRKSGQILVYSMRVEKAIAVEKAVEKIQPKAEAKVVEESKSEAEVEPVKEITSAETGLPEQNLSEVESVQVKAEADKESEHVKNVRALAAIILANAKAEVAKTEEKPSEEPMQKNAEKKKDNSASVPPMQIPKAQAKSLPAPKVTYHDETNISPIMGELMDGLFNNMALIFVGVVTILLLVLLARCIYYEPWSSKIQKWNQNMLDYIFSGSDSRLNVPPEKTMYEKLNECRLAQEKRESPPWWQRFLIKLSTLRLPLRKRV